MWCAAPASPSTDTARIFITGSSDGLGLMAAKSLLAEGHRVVLPARTARRAAVSQGLVSNAEHVVVGDVSILTMMRSVSEQVNALGRFDAVIHNVGLGYREPRRVVTEDGLSQLWAVNVLAPCVLTALIERPQRLVYLSSGMHPSGDDSLGGGPSAPDDLALAAVTHAWLAAGTDPATHVTGCYFYHQKRLSATAAAARVDLQERLLDLCSDVSGLKLSC